MDSRAEKLWRRGLAHFRQGNLEAAQASFEALLARDPGSGRALLHLSLVCTQRGRHGRAAELAEQALACDPALPGGGHAYLARCLLRAGAPERARAVAMRATSGPRASVASLGSLAGLMTWLDEHAQAIDLYGEAIAIDPGLASLRFDRAQAHLRFGQVEAAERDLEDCLRVAPGHAKAHWLVANLRAQDLASNHVARLARLLPAAAAADRETLALALFKELDDLGDGAGATAALRTAMAARGARSRAAAETVARHRRLVDALLSEPRSANEATALDGPSVFVVGMPRAGVGLLGRLLSRHSRLHWLGTQRAWSRQLDVALGRGNGLLDRSDLARSRTLDLRRLGDRFLADVLPAGAKPPMACASDPWDYLHVGMIARALPGARFVHVVRDPVDCCASLLLQPPGGGFSDGMDGADVAELHADQGRLMQHWHEQLPGRIIDVSYESLVEKPEMILRVLCSFLGIRYASSLRMGLQLHSRSIGRGRRYLAELPGLGEALARRDRAA